MATSPFLMVIMASRFLVSIILGPYPSHDVTESSLVAQCAEEGYHQAF